MKLPPPATFAEGQRAVALWSMSAAGAFYCLGTVGMILLLWLGGWSVRSEHDRLLYLALIGLSYALGSIAVTLALAVGGPVGRFKLGAGREGLSAELTDDASPPADPSPEPRP